MEYKKYANKKGRVLIGGGPRDRQAQAIASRIQSQQHTSGGADSDYIIQELRKELDALKAKPVDASLFTGEQVDGEIRKAVAEAINDIKKHYEGEVSRLEGSNKKLIESVEALNKEKDHLINKHYSFEKDVKEIKEEKVELEKAKQALEERILAKDEIIEVLKRDTSGGGDSQALYKIIEDQGKRIEELTIAVRSGGEVLIEDDPNRPQMEDTFVDPLEEDAGNELESFIDVEDVSLDEKEDMQEKVNKLKEIMGRM